LIVEVNQCKAILENKDAPGVEVVAALKALGGMGSLPTKVLGDTLIGKAVNNVAKNGADEAVRAKAKELVEEWRQAHRKRKSSGDGSQPPLKRGLSSSMSLASEAPSMSQDDATPSQATQPTQPEASLMSPPANPPAPAAQAPMERADSMMSLPEEASDASQSAANGAIPPHREKVRQKLVEALGQAEEIEAKDEKSAAEEKMRDPVQIAAEIDQALGATFPKKEEYLAQARSILYNLKDKKNHTFRFKVMVGFYKPSDLPKLNAEDMASDEKNAERAKQRKYAMEEIQSDWALKNGQQRITGMFTCGKCKGVKTTYFQMQTRSSDEPMTTFVTCLTCNNRWKFC